MAKPRIIATLIQVSCAVIYLNLESCLSRILLSEAPKDVNPSACLENLFWCSTNLLVKKLFLASQDAIPSYLPYVYTVGSYCT